jgi:hypothetical protein
MSDSDTDAERAVERVEDDEMTGEEGNGPTLAATKTRSGKKLNSPEASKKKKKRQTDPVPSDAEAEEAEDDQTQTAPTKTPARNTPPKIKGLTPQTWVKLMNLFVLENIELSREPS